MGSVIRPAFFCSGALEECDEKIDALYRVLYTVSHVRNSDSEAFDIQFYNPKLEKMSTIVKLPLIKIIYFIINIFF